MNHLRLQYQAFHTHDERQRQLGQSRLPATQRTAAETLNLKDVVVRAAEDAGCETCRIGDFVQDVDVVAHEQPLLGIMYSVLKEVCLRPQDQQLQVLGSVRDRWIVVTVKEFFRNADPLQGELWDDDGLQLENNSNLVVARKLAYYNEIGRHYRLDV